MSLFNKAKQAAEQAAAKAREGVEDVQQKRDLGQAYRDLGRTAFELLEAGEISNPKLDAAAAKIRELNAKIAETPAATSTAADDTVDPSQPPAMPT
jgi:outer membrane murein-binding lipoprotein Lpp